ncbi:MAG: ATP-binding cassette domain-containing protein, partial [Synergistota bacterium]|nr:ATP-binding cassette domain-containing protein [Synergistota bacterium]
NAPAYKVARLGAVRTFQIVHPLKDMTVLDNVIVGASLREKRMTRARETALRCLDWCSLSGLASFPAGDLTIGQKKRLEMARALATEPKLLMLDEAMAGLTSTEVNHSVDLLRKVRERGITLLVVEHIMEAIMPVADKMVVLDGGIKIAEGSPGEIIEDEKVIAAYFGEKFSKRLKMSKEAKNNG